MPNELWYWEKRVPEYLIDAVKHVRTRFEDARWKSATVTRHCCYAALHPELKPSGEQGEFVSALTILKAFIGQLATRYFHDLLKRGTPSAILAAFFHFYKAAMAVQVKSAFRDLLEIGQANAERLETEPIVWAEWQVKSVIKSASYQTGLWLKGCCDVESFDSLDFDWNAGEEEERVWTNWRSPRFVRMQPSLGMPYEASQAWEREDVETSKRVVKAFKDYFIIHLESQLEDLVGEAHLEAAKRVVRDATTDIPEPVVSPIRRLHDTADSLSEPAEPNNESTIEAIRSKVNANRNGRVRTHEAAKLLGVSSKTINRRVNDGSLTAGTKRGTIANASLIRQMPKSDISE